MKKLIILSFIIIILGCAVLYIKDDVESENNLFTFNADSIQYICFVNGNNGEKRHCVDREELAAVISCLNEFQYVNSMELEPAEGWTYRVEIHEKNGESEQFILRETSAGKSSIEMDGYLYISNKHGYFDDIIEKWY